MSYIYIYKHWKKKKIKTNEVIYHADEFRLNSTNWIKIPMPIQHDKMF